MLRLTITPSMFYTHLEWNSVNKSAGPDGIHPQLCLTEHSLLNEAQHVFVSKMAPITYIFPLNRICRLFLIRNKDLTSASGYLHLRSLSSNNYLTRYGYIGPSSLSLDSCAAWLFILVSFTCRVFSPFRFGMHCSWHVHPHSCQITFVFFNRIHRIAYTWEINQ